MVPPYLLARATWTFAQPLRIWPCISCCRRCGQTLALSNQSVTVCDNVLREESTNKAVKKVSHRPEAVSACQVPVHRFRQWRQHGAVMWLRCLPEGTVWEAFLSDDRGELRRDDHGKLLPGPHRRTAVLCGMASQLVSILRTVLIWAGIQHDPRWSAAAVAPVHCLCRGCGAPTRADVPEERNESHGCAAEDRAVASLARRACLLP